MKLRPSLLPQRYALLRDGVGAGARRVPLGTDRARREYFVLGEQFDRVWVVPARADADDEAAADDAAADAGAADAAAVDADGPSALRRAGSALSATTFRDDPLDGADDAAAAAAAVAAGFVVGARVAQNFGRVRGFVGGAVAFAPELDGDVAAAGGAGRDARATAARAGGRYVWHVVYDDGDGEDLGARALVARCALARAADARGADAAASWRCVETRAELRALVASLRPRGVREFRLRAALVRSQPRIEAAMRARDARATRARTEELVRAAIIAGAARSAALRPAPEDGDDRR